MDKKQIDNTVQKDRRLKKPVVATSDVRHLFTRQINPKGCIILMIPLARFTFLQIHCI